MYVIPVIKHAEKFKVGIQWYIMESKDFFQRSVLKQEMKNGS